jgi:hypothetical protein
LTIFDRSNLTPTAASVEKISSLPMMRFFHVC